MTPSSAARNTTLDQELLDLALAAVAMASEVTTRSFRSRDYRVTTKSSAADVVTDADVESELVTKNHLLGARPDDSFMGEEGVPVEGTSGVTWILDPIDSTANFARGIPIWSISLAALVDDDVRAAVVACPPHGEVFAGTRRTGVLLNGTPTPPPPKRDLDAAMVGIGWGPRPAGDRQAIVAGRLIPLVGKVRSPGSPALGLAWTAVGRFDAAYYEMDFNRWDVAAGSFLCECAGLTVTEAPPATAGASPRLLAALPHLTQPLADAVFGG